MAVSRGGWLTQGGVSGGWLTVSRGRGRAREPRERKGGRRRGSRRGSQLVSRMTARLTSPGTTIRRVLDNASRV